MKPENLIVFPPFRLDAGDQRLYRGNDPIDLRPKAFAVLSHLLQRPGQLVTKDELLETVWPATSISDAVLKVCIREIREALSDDPEATGFREILQEYRTRLFGIDIDAREGDSAHSSAGLRTSRLCWPIVPRAF